ncbi:MAG: hypothetical protein HF975_04415 [ANME-2 cluster archaeon]|nr:hypothetical protein [ANME-2 cluster archaeon]
MVQLEVTSLDDSDVKSAKGWKKVYKISLAGLVNGVSITLHLRSDDLDMLEEIVPFDKKAQRSITIEPVNHTLGSYLGAPGQTNLSQAEQEEADQDEELRHLRKELAEAEGQDMQDQ